MKTNNGCFENKCIFRLNPDINFQFCKGKYEKMSEIFSVDDINENGLYSLEMASVVNGEAKIKVIISFLDIEGKVIAQLHTENGKSFATPGKTAAMQIGFHGFSKNGGSVSLKELSLFSYGKKKERKVKLCAVAVAYNKGRRTFERNLKETLVAMDNAAKEKPDIICATECFYGRNVKGLSLKEKSIPLDGEVIGIFKERAKKYNSYISFSVHILKEDGNFSNVAVIIDRKGEIAGTYSKVHNTISEFEGGMEPGNEIKFFDLDFGRVGIAICWDLFFPEHVRMLHLNDCEIILNPTAGFEEERTKERAKESGAYIVTAGTQRQEHTIITNPEGVVIARREKGKDYVYAEVDLSYDYYVDWLSCPSSSTRKNVFRYERHPELYI